MENEEQKIHTFTTPELAKFISEFINHGWNLDKLEQVGFNLHNTQISLESYLSHHPTDG